MTPPMTRKSVVLKAPLSLLSSVSTGMYAPVNADAFSSSGLMTRAELQLILQEALNLVSESEEDIYDSLHE